MKKLLYLGAAITLVLSMAVPPGAVFASETYFEDEHSVESIPFSEEDQDTLANEPIDQDEIVTPTIEDTLIIEPQTIVYKLNIDQDEGEDIDSEPEPPLVVQHPGVVVSHVVTGLADAANHELIEIFNNSDVEVDVTGWCVEYRSSGLTARSLCLQPREQSAHHVMLPAQSYAVFVSTAYAAAYPDFSYDGQLTNNGLAEVRGSVVLRDANNITIDGIAWGNSSPASAQIQPVEGESIARQPVRGQALERKTSETVRYQDTDDNAEDFMTTLPRELYQAGALRDVTDYCLNLPGIQDVVPDGLYRDEQTGMCTDIPPPPPPSVNLCEGARLSEIAANVTDQFIELVNPTNAEVEIGGCLLQTNRSQTRNYVIPAETRLGSGEYYVVQIADTELTLTKTTSGTVYLLSSDGMVEADSVSYSGLSADTSWVLIDEDWLQTFTLTPGAANSYAQYPPCEEGYFRNLATGRCNRETLPVVQADCGPGRYRSEETGRCRNIESASTLVPCRADQYRSEETNRCRIITSASTLVPCRIGQERNPLTNRCRNIASTASSLVPCREGQERNPATNRCRNIPAATPAVAGFATEEVADSAAAIAGWWLLGALAALGLGYAGWEWRSEIRGGVRRIGAFFAPGK